MSLLKFSLLTGLVTSAIGVPAAAAQQAVGNAPAPSTPSAPTAAPAPPAANAVIEWNRTLLSIVRTKTPQPLQPATIHPTRAFAILHLGVYDAVVAASGGKPYLPERVHRRPASAAAAANQAAHDVLVALYPSDQAALDAQLAAALAGVRGGLLRARGIAAGHSAAEAILADRANDGSQLIPPPYTQPATAGVFEPSPPAQAAFTQWAKVKPFALARASQFQPRPPAPLDSPAYLATLQQVQSLGRSNSTTRTPEQTTIATFWGGGIWDYWNEIAQSASLAHHDTLVQDARLFAQLNTAFADSAIAFYQAKYTYHLWRPQSAIRTGIPGLVAEPSWTPLGKTPAEPSYPGAHATISEAGAVVLSSFFHSDKEPLTVTSEVMSGTTRRFSSFSAAADEASASRIFAGVHTAEDEQAGQRLGAKVAQFVLRDSKLANKRGLARQPGHGR
jgi:hypothetical protein